MYSQISLINITNNLHSLKKKNIMMIRVEDPGSIPGPVMRPICVELCTLPVYSWVRQPNVSQSIAGLSQRKTLTSRPAWSLGCRRKLKPLRILMQEQGEQAKTCQSFWAGLKPRAFCSWVYSANYCTIVPKYDDNNNDDDVTIIIQYKCRHSAEDNRIS